MINQIKFSELTVYKKHCMLYRDRNVLRRLFYQNKSGTVPVRISKDMLMFDLLHHLHNS